MFLTCLIFLLNQCKSPFHNSLCEQTRYFTFNNTQVQIQQKWANDGKGGTTLGFGASVYNAAIALSLYIEKNCHLLEGKNVIELGCGPGLVSIAAAVVGASNVMATDGDDGSVELTKANIEKNIPSLNCDAQKYLWGDLYEGRKYDVVLAADVVALPYEQSFKDLITSFKLLCKKTGCILLAYKKRHECENRFFDSIDDEFSYTFVPETELHDDFKNDNIKLCCVKFK